MAFAPGSTKAVTRWTTRIVPLILAGCVGFATYVVVARICVRHLVDIKNRSSLAVGILVLYFIFFTLMVITYMRTLLVINSTPGLVPLGHSVPHDTEQYRMSLRGGDGREHRKRRWRRRTREPDDIESRPYTPSTADHIIEPDLSPDSPGLERFYTKNVFVCATDGRPVWCSACRNWKPDRAHHSSEMERCVRRMDHYCPWVGGIVSETSFKYFVQFTFYATLYCAVVLAIAAYTLSDQIRNPDYGGVDGTVIGALALAAFFGLFVFTMTATSFRFIFINLTNVDVLSAKSKVYQLAVRIPRGSPATAQYAVITYPLPKPPQQLNGYQQQQQQQQTGSSGPGGGQPTYQPYLPNGHAASPPLERVSSRDLRAMRTFAIVRTLRGENPWDRGYRANWESVMGRGPLDWLLPLRPSPCAVEESSEGFYRMGPLLDELRRRYNLPTLPPEERGDGDGGSRQRGGVEMREV